jgi:hypothetical protein
VRVPGALRLLLGRHSALAPQVGCACAAPTRVPTNVGDTSPPTFPGGASHTTAATAAGMPVGSPFIKADSIYPRGCYLYTVCSYSEDGCNSYSSSVYFNPHPDPVGAGDAFRKLLCAELSGETGLVFTGTYLCGWQRTAARINVTAWPSAARVEFVPAPARSFDCEMFVVCHIARVCRVSCGQLRRRVLPDRRVGERDANVGTVAGGVADEPV